MSTQFWTNKPKYYINLTTMEPIDMIEINTDKSKSVIGWKKVYLFIKGKYHGKGLVKLKVPVGAQRILRSNSNKDACDINFKCRAEYVQVLDLYYLSNSKKPIPANKHAYGLSMFAISLPYSFLGEIRTPYVKGQTVYPDGYNSRTLSVCEQGIHFFLDVKQARNY